MTVKERMLAVSTWLLDRAPLRRSANLPAPLDESRVVSLRLSETPGIAAPAEASLEAEDVSHDIRVGLFILALFFGGLGGWAAFAPLRGATIAPAIVKVEGSRKAVQHPDGGSVSAIFVQEGSKVTAGDVLMTLDDTIARTNLNLLIQQHDALRAQEARLVAEMSRSNIVGFPLDLMARADDPQVASILKGQSDLFQSQATILTGQIDVMGKRINELQEQIRGVKAQNISRAKQLASVQAELSSLNTLYEKGLITRTRVLELERAAQRLRGEENELAANMARDQQTIEQTRQQILQVQYERYGQAANDLRDTQNRLADVSQRLLVAREGLDQTRIKAPASGVILGMTIFTVGAVVQKGERLMEIVPNTQLMAIEAMIKVDDIIYVQPGMPVEVRVTAFKTSITPVIKGEIVHVSPDRMTEQRSGTPYYLAQIRIPPDELALLPQRLQPGMAVTAVIPTGERTALGYLLQPLRDAMAMAFREH